jgi:hypothetical protein
MKQTTIETPAPIKGLQYIVDESGQRVAAVVNLQEWGELWEDFLDVLVSESRKNEPAIAWETLKAEAAG